MKKDNLEDLFKDSFENFEADVNPSVWKNVQTALKGVGLGLLGKMLLNKLGSSAVISIVSSAAAVIATVFVMNGTKTETKTVEPKKEVQPKVVSEVVKPSVDEIKTFLAPEKKEVKETPVVVKNEVETKKTNPLTITNDKINSVLKVYSEQSVADISASPISGQAGLVVNFTNNGVGKTNKWDFGDGRKETSVNPPHYYDEPGIYTA
ncbi:MAG TPA: PKD domain-containing protein, partial [Bacteroidia bacterium]|nr:PKD domain-containing protein [Bacteroidia bacterium]